LDASDFWPPLDDESRAYLEAVQEDLEYCTYCQPYDDGEIVWILGEKSTVDELLEEAGVPEEYWEAVLCRLRCPNCGYQGFEEGEVVGKIHPVDARTQALIDEGRERFGAALADFAAFLSRTQLLGMGHLVGTEIRRAISEGSFPHKSVSGVWYRARILEGATILNTNDLSAPDLGVCSGGRYNHAGEKVIYLANDLGTACLEVIPDPTENRLVWLQEFQLEKADRILNLVNDWQNLTGIDDSLALTVLAEGILEEKGSSRSSMWKPQYFVTRFVSDCAKSAGYEGILYKSVRGVGVNLILFNPDNHSMKPICKPRVLQFPDDLRQDDEEEPINWK
jgi:RES domain-containing protein